MTGYDKLVKALRWNGTEYKGSTMDEEDKNMYLDAADAIEALQAELEKKRTADCWGCRCEKLEPKRGEWILVEDKESYHYECSECGARPLYSRYGDVVFSGFCFLCGAKMEVHE